MTKIVAILLWTVFAVPTAPYLPFAVLSVAFVIGMFLATAACLVGLWMVLYGLGWAYKWLDEHWDGFQSWVNLVKFLLWAFVLVGGSLWVVVGSIWLLVAVVATIWNMFR
ncbi:uncharacterized protein PV06_04745 [Exophiala oligosperma]|uniref:Uncharacterized protein n=1 Tax=Exophiala oligosperma TaxID=215243 RepID=A0A0D2AV27_9EURO|nr:uncharacterized protein PV06_04745 [Exophiala oligosperma]KIW43666.1 hypothetical protein PV06_04745 [Exophiala oligosperma]